MLSPAGRLNSCLPLRFPATAAFGTMVLGDPRHKIEVGEGIQDCDAGAIAFVEINMNKFWSVSFLLLPATFAQPAQVGEKVPFAILKGWTGAKVKEPAVLILKDESAY